MVVHIDCSVSWCIRTAVGKGLCAAHGERARRGKDLETPFRKGSKVPGKCSVKGCPRDCATMGSCTYHYILGTKNEKRSLHGLSYAERHEMLDAQGGVCDSCGDEIRFGTKDGWSACIDHNHSHCPGAKGCRDCVRGILCRGCNISLGYLKDDPTRIIALIEYLEKHGVERPR